VYRESFIGGDDEGLDIDDDMCLDCGQEHYRASDVPGLCTGCFEEAMSWDPDSDDGDWIESVLM
jgi:hypothetical protein